MDYTDLSKDLKLLKEESNEIFLEIFEEALEDTLKEAKEIVPKDTHALEKSLVIEREELYKFNINSPLDYARIVELGNSKRKGAFYITKSLNTFETSLEKRFKNRIAKR